MILHEFYASVPHTQLQYCTRSLRVLIGACVIEKLMAHRSVNGRAKGPGLPTNTATQMQLRLSIAAVSAMRRNEILIAQKCIILVTNRRVLDLVPVLWAGTRPYARPQGLYSNTLFSISRSTHTPATRHEV